MKDKIQVLNSYVFLFSEQWTFTIGSSLSSLSWLNKSSANKTSLPGSHPCDGRDGTLLILLLPPFISCGWIYFLCIRICFVIKGTTISRVFHYKTLRETNSIPYPSTKQKRCIFQLLRIKLASSWHTSGTSKHSLDVCNVLHFEANKNIIWLHTANNLISLLWDTGASGHKVLFASTELDLFIISSSLKLRVYGCFKWLSEQCLCIKRHLERALARKIQQHSGLCFCFVFLQIPLEFAVLSVQLKFISLSNSEDKPCGLVYSLNWPYPAGSLHVYIFIYSKSCESKAICIYFTHLDWSAECGFFVWIFPFFSTFIE